MIVIETKEFQIGKFRSFVQAMSACGDNDRARLTVDDTGGNLTINIHCGNNVSCFAIRRADADN